MERHHDHHRNYDHHHHESHHHHYHHHDLNHHLQHDTGHHHAHGPSSHSQYVTHPASTAHHGSRRPSQNFIKAPSISEICFDSDTVKSRLHTLGKHPYLLNISYLGVSLNKVSMTDNDLKYLAPYSNLMFVDISGNHISDISVFSSFSALVQLNASDNSLTTCLDFSPLKCGFGSAWCSGELSFGSMLTMANLSRNQIKELGHLARHPFLECLILSHNCIDKICNVSNLRFLKVLDLSYNCISKIEDLENTIIEELNLEGNSISDLSGLRGMSRLTTLNVAKNNVTSLSPLAALLSLATLNVQANKIDIIRQVEFLSNLDSLRTLELRGNPCCVKAFMRERVIYRLPRLVKLDLTIVSAEEKIRSFNLYFAEAGDVQLRGKVFADIFPESEFQNSGPMFYDEELELSMASC